MTEGEMRETKNLDMPQLRASSQISPAACVRMCANNNTLTPVITDCNGSLPAKKFRKPAILILKTRKLECKSFLTS
jgi:hypothetical protein